LKEAKEVSTEELLTCFFSRTLPGRGYEADEERTRYATLRNFVQLRCNELFSDVTQHSVVDASTIKSHSDGSAVVTPANIQRHANSGAKNAQETRLAEGSKLSGTDVKEEEKSRVGKLLDNVTTAMKEL
jgi:hypothetical protein